MVRPKFILGIRKDRIQEMVRTRMAPSPTGKLHIGTAHTTLFNYLLARKYQGRLVLRMDDTDQARSSREFETDIIEGLKWLGLSWDEGPDVGGPYAPYRQSERGEIYRKYVDMLMDSGWGYRCFCTEAELEKDKINSRKRGDAAYLYSGKCRKLTNKQIDRYLSEGKKFTVRVRTDLVKNGEKVIVDDRIRGRVEVEPEDVGDFIVVRSDGSPVLLLTATIDDIEMKINTAIRGEDMLNVTFRMWFIYQALKEKMPLYGHKPFMYAQDGKKLSKRHGATAIEEFRQQGYLPEAILNYLFMVGYSPKNSSKQIFSLDEMIEDFDWINFQKGMPRFDYQKLDWYNAEYIRKMTNDELLNSLVNFLTRHKLLGFEQLPDKKVQIGCNYQDANLTQRDDDVSSLLVQIAPLVKERITKLSDFTGLAGFFFKRPLIPDSGWETESLRHLQKAVEALKNINPDDWSLHNLSQALTEAVRNEGFKTGNFFMSLRLAICGKKVTPPLSESIVILGKREIISRMREATTKLEKKFHRVVD